MVGGPKRHADLPSLVRHLSIHGPIKTLPTSKRIRLQFASAIIADTTSALYVWEHEFYPQLYIPMHAFLKPAGHDVNLGSGDVIEEPAGNVVGGMLKLAVRPKDGGDGKWRVLRDMAIFASDLEGRAEGLRDYVKVEFASVDAWYEEDTQIHIHPKDPFKRVDTLFSTRGIRVSLDGHLLAESATCVHLYETSLQTRYYLPPTALRHELLRPSSDGTTSGCPYKGVAEYCDVVLPETAAGLGGGNGAASARSSASQGVGKVHKDLVWYYRNPTVECAKIEGLRCFYNEKVDIWLEDGRGEWVRVERPVTHFV